MDWKKLIVMFFYGTIKGIVMKFLKGVLAGISISDDILMAIIGWLLMSKTSYKWLGEGILYGAVVSLGLSGGISLGGIIQQQPGFSMSGSEYAGVMPNYRDMLTRIAYAYA